MAEKCYILVMASGNGSNFQAVYDSVASGQIPNSSITGLLVNRQKAFAIKRAEENGIPWEYFNLISNGFQAKSETSQQKIQEARDEYDAALAKKVLNSSPRPHLIVLAGWMYVFGRNFLNPLETEGIKIINLHPALPGKYDGANAIERAFDDFQNGKLENDTTGIMVHHVIQQVDQGEAIMTREVKCQKGDDLPGLRKRIQAQEHELIVEATTQVVKGILADRQHH